MKLLVFDALPRSVWISDKTLLLVFDNHIFAIGYDQMKLLVSDALPRSVWISDETLLLVFDTLLRSV